MMRHVRLILVLAVAAVMALPAVAKAGTNPTRASLRPTATYLTPSQATLEVSVSCEAGLYFSISAAVLQQEGAYVYGDGYASAQCTGHRQTVAVPVYAYYWPGWQLGDALATVSVCAFTCDTASRSIRIVL
jgi:hypothetical protein